MQSTLFQSPAGPLVLRPYQAAAREAVYHHLRTRDDNPVVVIPTGGGKTPVIGSICSDAVTQWGGRVLILSHVKELLQQAADNLARVCPRVPVGVFSAGLKRREKRKPVTVAGIQSIYKLAFELEPFDLVLVDEAHLIPPEGDGMYRQFLADAKLANPKLRIVGFTATPFRMKSGLICTADGFLNSICYEVGVRELIVDGYLSPLVTKGTKLRIDTSALHVRGGEFMAEEVEALVDADDVVRPACEEIVQRAADRSSVLVFTCSVKHGQHVRDTLARLGQDARFICGDKEHTTDEERARAVRDFKDGALKYLVNVNVFTTGFDAPNVDCVALMRPTNSPGLYYQMVGRGFRLFPGKKDCLVLDYGGNVTNHGPVDQIKVREMAGKGKGEAPAKECPNCQSLIAAGYAVCPDCGYEFPPPEKPKHDPRASGAGILSGQVSDADYVVEQVLYSLHHSRRKPDAPPTLRVDYLVGGTSPRDSCKSEWVCFGHEGYARQKALTWWRQRSNEDEPADSAEALEICQRGGVADCEAIRVRTTAGADFPERIIDWVLGDKPEPGYMRPEELVEVGFDDIPF